MNADAKADFRAVLEQIAALDAEQAHDVSRDLSRAVILLRGPMNAIPELKDIHAFLARVEDELFHHITGDDSDPLDPNQR